MDVAELGTQLTFGALAGFCSGYALKKVSKGAAVVLGLGFIGVQLARHHGFIAPLDWARAEDEMVRALDADGDGKVTINDARIMLRRTVEVLGFNVPSGAAFATAFYLGLRYG